MNNDNLIDILYGYKKTLALMISNKYKIFDFLKSKARSLAEISEHTGFIENRIKVLLDILIQVKLIEKENALYQNTIMSNKYLVSTEKTYMGYLIDFETEEYQTFLTMRNIEMAFKEEHMLRETLNQRVYMGAMQHAIRYASIHMVRAINKKRMVPQKILDLGGGTGESSVILCRAFPKAQAVIYDLPETREFALENARKNNLEGRISIKSGNCLKDDIGCNYDVIIMSNILHFFNEDKINEVILRSKKALMPEGIILIHDFFINNASIIPSLLSLDWLLLDVVFNYSIAQMKEIVMNLGFKNPTEFDLPELPTSMILFEND
jgi:ubiquinone/menaquinone biosynthesis C-methylase UbiE